MTFTDYQIQRYAAETRTWITISSSTTEEMRQRKLNMLRASRTTQSGYYRLVTVTHTETEHFEL